MDRKALIGLLSGVVLVIVTLIGVAMVNTPEAEGAAPPVRAMPHDCALGSKPVEAGYEAIPGNEVCARSY